MAIEYPLCGPRQFSFFANLKLPCSELEAHVMNVLRVTVAAVVFSWMLAGVALATDRTVGGQLITEPPTLISLGFEWEIEGDDNRNAEVAVYYRKKGTDAWNEGLPLLRLQHERIN